MTGDDPRVAVPSWRRWLPVAVLVACMALAFAMGWHRLISFKTVGLHYDELRAFIANHLLTALAIYALAYIAVVALSLPGGLVMTVSGGLLFGWELAVPVTVVAATVGATIVFLIAKSSIGEPFAAKAGPWLGKLRSGFAENALSYMLFLRLVPAFPFVVVNLAPALLGVPLQTYVIGTLLGIIPGTVVFAVTGAGLGSVVEAQNQAYAACLAKAAAQPGLICHYAIDKGSLLTKEIVAAFILLGVLALIPVAVKKWSKRDAAA
jgi:uncharacterized membrane protein YdjX (TVP38/TMEM64 family)